MQGSTARLNGVRVALGILAIWWFIFGMMGIFFPQAMVESIFHETMTPAIQTISFEAGAMTLGWAVAFGLAFLDPLANRTLMQAIVVIVSLFFLAEIYVTFAFGANWPQAFVWGSNVLLLILDGVLIYAYPWKGPSRSK